METMTYPKVMARLPVHDHHAPDDVVRVGLRITQPDDGPTEAVTISVESHGAVGPFVVFTGRWADLVDYFAKLTA